MNSFLYGLTIAYFAAQTSAYAILIGLIMLIILAVMINFYSSYERMKKTVGLLNEEMQRKNNIILHLENEKKYFPEGRKMLVKDMHDRVINNLQIVASLLNTQSFYLKNEEALKAIRISQQRLYAISLIHHIMNQSEDFSSLNIRNYIYALVEYLVDRTDVGKKIHFDIQIENIYLDLSQGAPIGLILHEAITNAINFGFPNEIKGVVSVHMTRYPQQILLTISDNGVGLPPNYDANTGNTFGFRLMEGLTGQLGGDLKMENQAGVKIEILFPDPDYLNRNKY
jgi:two-component sensor histidine kinase